MTPDLTEEQASHMKKYGWVCLDAGHTYAVINKHETGLQLVKFVKDEQDCSEDGIIIQQLIKILLDRIRYLDDKLPSKYNNRVIKHLTQAFIALETRHIERLVKKGRCVEYLPVYKGGHILPSANSVPKHREWTI